MVDISKIKRLRKDDLFIWALSRYSIPEGIETKKELLEWLELIEEETPQVKVIIESSKIRKDFINYPSALPTGRMS